ncbi:MAG TPA: hypothetical protein VGN23_11225 [Verrucomicrobiae bacterium]
MALLINAGNSQAQGTTAFTYQGQLHDTGTNANGAYTMIFGLYDSISGGNQIGNGITNSATLANGLFTVNLDFGAGAFNGAARYLDITVSNGVAQELSPRVQVLPTPYAQYAAVAASANIAASANAAATATNVVSGINVTNAFITNSIFAGNGWGLTNLQLTGAYTNAVTFNDTNNIFIGKFTGTGNGLTNIPVSAIMGGTNSNAMTFSNSTNTFVGAFIGNGNALTNIPASGIVGLLYKQAVQEATTSNLPPYTYNNAAGTISGAINALLGLLQVDGITVTPGDSVLVKNDGAYNGIYVCTINASENDYILTRRSDFNTTNNLTAGDMVSVVQGAVNANTTWFLTTSAPITIGTTPLTFALQLPASIFTTAAGPALANGVVTNANLTANAVGTVNIQAGAITTLLIATNAVNATNIASGQVVKSINGLTDFVALTAGANTALFTNGNTLQMSAVVPNVVGFTSSGTFTVPTNVTRIRVEIWGGGGGGGNGSSSYPGGGGGAGAYIFNVFNVTPGTGYTVTVGSGGNAGQAGGTSSFGALMSATGGHAGSAGGSSQSGAGGSGGTTSGGVGPLIGSAGDGGSTFTGAGGNGASAAGELGGTGGWGDAGSPPGNNSNGNGAGGGGGAASGGGGGTGGGGLVVVYY